MTDNLKTSYDSCVSTAIVVAIAETLNWTPWDLAFNAVSLSDAIDTWARLTLCEGKRYMAFDKTGTLFMVVSQMHTARDLIAHSPNGSLLIYELTVTRDASGTRYNAQMVR